MTTQQKSPIYKATIIVDLISFLCLLFLVITGLVLHFHLPPGSGRALPEGVSQGLGGRPVTLWLGLTRHEWGEIHFWVAVLFLLSISMHLLIHWRWIFFVLKGQPHHHSLRRLALGLLGFLTIVFLFTSPLYFPRETLSREELYERRISDSPIEKLPIFKIKGGMTVGEISQKSGVPKEYFLEELGISEEVSDEEKVGRLSRIYGFSLEDLHNVLRHYEE